MSPAPPVLSYKYRFIAYLSKHLTNIISPLFIQCFVLTFIAEWGDRSQLSTIVMSSRWSASIVTLGCLLGHMCCTGLAVISGTLVSQHISEQKLQFLGGTLFFIFAIHGFFEVLY